MDIKKVVDLIPESVKYDTMNFEDVILKNGRPATRVTMCRLLTDDELAVMRGNCRFVGVGCIARYRYAPEIRKSYFYVV